MNLTIIGCGAFAQGIASLLQEKNKITMWVHDSKEIPNLKKVYPMITFETNLNKAVLKAEAIFILVSSSFFKNIIDSLPKMQVPIYIGTKGMLANEFFTTYTKKTLKNDSVFFLAGPNLASDLINKTPVGITLSQDDYNFLKKLMPNYVTIDKDFEPNLEFYSIFKNIVAIGSGILYELTKSSSSLATYLTKALQEITNTKILYGTIGDYYMTSTSFNSRNFTFGTLIAKNRIEAQNYLANNTVEGYDMLKTLKSYLTSQSQFVSIINILYDIIYENKKETILLDYLK